MTTTGCHLAAVAARVTTPNTARCLDGSRRDPFCPLTSPVDGTDREIDRLVCELYGLTDAEISLVEEATE